MKISTKLRIAVYIPALMALVIIVALVFSYQELKKIMDNGDTVRQMRSSITELNHFVFSYIHYHDERPKQQFLAEHDALTQQITSMKLLNPEQQNLLNNIHNDIITMKDLFSQLVSFNERVSKSSMNEYSETEDRLAGLLLFRSYQADVDAALLRSLVDDGIKTTAEMTIGLIYAILFLTGIPITIILVGTRRGIVSSLSNLSKGAAIIGSGNLNYTIDDKRNDEIGDLSRSFNLMTINLKDITASKSMLENEIIERKRTENALRESEESLKRAQEIAHLGSWELNLVDNRLSWSDEIYRIFNLKPQEFTATYEAFLDAVHPDDRALVDTAYLNSVREGRDSYEIEHRIVRKSSGEIRYVHERCLHVRDKSGKIIRSVGMVHDITERKKAEEVELQLTRKLEALKDEFNGMVSHELKTPLTVIIGALRVAEMETITFEQARELIHDAATSAESLAIMVDNLLELARHQSNRLSLQTEKTQIEPVVQTITRKLYNSSTKHHLTVDIPPELPEVWIDPIRIERVLHNLIENAIKYSPDGGEIRIFGHHKDSQLVIGVSDQGIGIPAEDQSKLFQSFQRLDIRNKYNIPGIGFGLMVCRILVEAHNGHIWVESNPTGGSTFFFTLPVAETPNNPSKSV